MLAGGLVALGGGWLLADDGGSAPVSGTRAPRIESSGSPPSTSLAAPPTPVYLAPADLAGWMTVLSAMPPLRLPSECRLPFEEPESLPNSERSYRGGVHEGVDFICLEPGRDAVAAMPGTVLMANNSFVDPSPAEREAVLDVARELGRTPPWTLAMLFGRFVVLDHGIFEGAGHVVSVYAHLREVDPSIRPGAVIEAGARIGEIGNLGTEPAATGADDPRAIHLHWELHVNDVYLGAGLTAPETRQLYETLFVQTS